ncbi:MAG: hypothetical protein QOE54_1847 [Streptosporangiaceae bacterium]|jgi:hypothetical protein|nr:hypothetical protein [Streptosporangiaceae bacterium]MDX6429481.1 hypothetical protein [Streptosporangiaceae bacterium]
MYHHDIAYSIMRQRVAERTSQAAADRLAAEAVRAAKVRRIRERADSPCGPDAPESRGWWLRRLGARA